MANDLLDNSMRETELGPLPSEWDILTLGQVTVFLQYGTSERCHEEATGSPVLRIPNVIGGSINTCDLKYADLENGEKAKYELARGDLLFVRTNGQKQNIGRCAAYNGAPSGALFASYLIRARVKPDVADYTFVEFYSSSVVGRSFLSGRASNAADGKYNINTQILKDVLIPLPPLEEQQLIAHVLRTVQQAKEATKKVIAAARQLKQSLMRHLFAYGPVPVEQADQVPQRETDYGAVPETWKMLPLSECAVVQTGVAKGRKLNGAEAITVPYLRVANVQDGYLDLSEIKDIEIRRSELSRFSLEAGDVVLTEGGDFDKLGRGFIWNGEVPGCVHQNHIFAVRANRDLLMPEFLAYLTQSAYGKAYFLSVAHKTTNLACINTTKLKALPTLVPPKEEQAEIVAAMKGVDQKIAIEERKRNALDLLFRTLLHHLMTGKVRVNELELPAMKEGSP